MATPSTRWVNRKIEDVRRRMDTVEATKPGSDWRKQAAKATAMASLRTEEARLRRMLPQEPTDDLQF